MNYLQAINPAQETERIISFLKQTFKKQHIENAVVGLSGGIDSATSFYLIKNVLASQNIFVAHLSYFPNSFPEFLNIAKDAKIPQENIYNLSIKKSVDAILSCHPEQREGSLDQIRKGNIMARTRMIFLYDIAKKNNAMVVGTENKSEHLLGYFTRFGDAASDIEPIQHLYKTQVYELAKYLGIPKEIIEAKPSANLWQNQTDEGEFGFTYTEADQVLYLYFEKKESVEEIVKKGLANAEKIISRALNNQYKHLTPYIIKASRI